MRQKTMDGAGYLAAAICLLYACAGVAWWQGAPGFPFGIGDAELVAAGEDALTGSVLGLSTPQVAGPMIAVVGVAAAAAILAMLRGAGPRPLLIGAGWTIAAVLAVAIQDYRPLIVVAYSLILLVTKPIFGWPAEVGFAELYTWPRISLLLLLVTGILIGMTTFRYARRTAEAGRDRSGSLGSRRVGGIAVAVAVAVPLIYCSTRWLWALGFSLGFPAEAYAEGQRSGLWIAGALLATLGAGGAILTLGLVQRWGEVFPRWMIGLAGRRVPPMLAVIPATFVSVLVTGAGLMYIRRVVFVGVSPETYAATLPETLWPVWGVALFIATMSYLRRRQTCDGDRAGRLETEMR